MSQSRYLISLLCIILGCPLMAQESEDVDIIIIDSLYREDQVYIGLTFNLLTNQPAEFSQNGLSAGIQGGFIRDIPINKRRNKAFGIGLGIGIDTYNQNLFIGERPQDEVSIFTIIDNTINEDVNRFTTYRLEMPLEYRWRTSTPTKYSFWRIHAGIQLGYVFHFKSTFQQENNEVVQTDVPEFNRLQYGPSLSFGYGAFNFKGYYGLSTLFNDNAKLNGETVDLQVIKLGLIFYFL